MRISDWSSDVCSSDLYDLSSLGLDFLIVDRPGDELRLLGRPGGEGRGINRWICCIARGRHRFAKQHALHIAHPVCPQPGDRNPSTRGVKERSEEHTSELQSLMRISYAVICLKQTNTHNKSITYTHQQNNIQSH